MNYISDYIINMRFLGLNKKKDGKKTFWRNDWMSFYPGFYKLNFKISPAGYFDNRAQVDFSFGWGQFYIDIPFIRSKYDECDPPRYGFYFYSVSNWIPDSFVWCWKRKTYFYYMPWSLDWVRTSILLKDETWVHETKKNRKDFYKVTWDELRWINKYPYTYIKNNGDIQFAIATVKVSEIEWRPKWFKWTKVFAKIRKSIDVEFDREIGEGEGSYKGGVLGCGHNMLKNETPLQCLLRMQDEVRFNR